MVLSPAQLGTLCDWSAGRLGGYGHSVQCPDGGSGGPYDDQASCVASLDFIGGSCTLAVGAYEDCINALMPDPCLIGSAAACAELRACL
jgi:hypothetical protein